MAEDNAHSATVEVQPQSSAHEQGSGGIMDVSFPMIGLTWVTFIIMTIILYKVAWKPILNALDLRENSIKKALEDAEKARAELAAIEERRIKMIKDAEAQQAQMLAEARIAAEGFTRTTQNKAREEARAMVDDAKREIASATEKARLELRKETTELALAIAAKCVERSMDSNADRELVQKLIKEM